MLFSCVPPRKTPEPGAERRGERDGVAVRVDDGDLRRAGDPRAAAPPRTPCGARGRGRRGCSAVVQPSRARATIAPPREGAGVASTSLPRNGVRRLGLRDLVGGEVVGELGEQLRGGRRASSRMSSSVGTRSAVSTRSGRRRCAGRPPRAGGSREDPVQERLRLADVDAAAGELDRRLDELRPRQAAEAAMRLLEPGEEPGHGDRAQADVEDLRRGVGEVDHELLHLAERPGGRRRRSSRGAVASPPTWASRKPPPAGPVSGPSATNAANAAAMQASTALPPFEYSGAGFGGERVTGGDRAVHVGSVNLVGMRITLQEPKRMPNV